MLNLDAARFRFLYRESEGTIGPREWVLASLGPVGIALILTLIAFAVAPNAPRDLAHEAFFDPLVAARHAYLIVYAFALILCAVAEYFVSAKRFADRGKPPALAGLAPFALLIAGAAYWYQPRSEGTMPESLVTVFAALAVAIIAWNVIELGFGPSRGR
jgi:hypothetical protein